MRLLALGGNTLIGSHILDNLHQMQLPNFEVAGPTTKEYDICKPIDRLNCDAVLLMTGYTNAFKAQNTGAMLCSHVNVAGVANVATVYAGVPFIFISSEYAYNPINWLGMTKIFAENIIKANTQSYLILRTLFKENPFIHDMAFADQFTKADYVDVIAKLIAQEIVKWDGKPQTKHIGTERKTMYELAKRTNLNVKPNFLADIPHAQIPKDYIKD